MIRASDSRVKFIDRVVKGHDRELMARRNNEGKILILRQSKRFVPFHQSENETYFHLVDSPHLVCALTDSWSVSGKPVEWGSMPIIERLKLHDVWNNEEFIRRFEEYEDNLEKSKARQMRNQNEAFLGEVHSKFKKDWKDINTSNMDKSESRRRLYEQRSK
jgi:hypothetical protein